MSVGTLHTYIDTYMYVYVLCADIEFLGGISTAVDNKPV